MNAAARARIEPFVAHGGRIDLARAAFPEVDAWVDLSTGIAPWAYPADFSAIPLAGLPDPALLAELEARAAAAFGVAAARVVAVPGSDMALHLLGMVLPGPAAWAPPGYSGHRLMWPPGKALVLEREALLDVPDGVRAAMLARPNNPDGWMADESMLEQAATRLAATGGHLVIDEAFADAAAEHSLVSRDWPGLIVLRSFGKFFGLGGLRLGFVIAPPTIVAALRALIGDWPISTPALHAGIAAYADIAWQAAQRERLDEAKQRMAALLGQHDIAIAAQTAFFTLVRTRQRDALFCRHAEAGVLTRPFADQPDWLRIGVPGSAHAWARLANALTGWSVE
jgi:cobalamin biosynthesis protein CobC